MTSTDDKSIFFDVIIPETFYPHIEGVQVENLWSRDKFNKEQSKDFYLGMMAGLRNAIAIADSFKKEGVEKIIDGMGDIALMATIIAKSKEA